MTTTTTLTTEERTAILEREVSKYVKRRFRVVARTPTTAQLVKPKRFRFWLFVLLALVVLLPGLLYLLWYVAQRDEQVYLEVDAGGKIRRTKR